MGKVKTLFAVALAFAVTSVCQAATLISTDFTKNANGWMLNQDAKLAAVAGDTRAQVLQLTQNEGGQTGTAWTTTKFKVNGSMSYIADIRIRFTPPNAGDCPADGVALAFAPVDADVVGGGGGSIGLFGGALETFTAFEINTWRGAGLGNDDERGVCTSGKNETFAIDIINPKVDNQDRAQDGVVPDAKAGGAKIGQIVPPKGLKIVNGGMYRYQWNVTDNGLTHTVFVTGLDKGTNDQFQKVKVLEVKLPNADPVKDNINFEGRFGLTAATGGAVMFTDIAAARVESPAVDPQ